MGVDSGELRRALDEVIEELEQLVVDFRPERISRNRGEGQPWERARAIYRARKARAAVFGKHGDLFADPAWDLLLDLFIARETGKRVSVSSACIAANVPPTTALRWLTILETRGLVDREADQADRRRSYIRLTPDGAAMMRRWLETWGHVAV